MFADDLLGVHLMRDGVNTNVTVLKQRKAEVIIKPFVGGGV